MKERNISTSGTDRSGPTAHSTAAGRLTEKQREKQRRRQRALELHLEGWTLDQIAKELGWSGPSGVSYALKQARKELNEVFPVTNAEELRQLNYWRLEALLQGVWPFAVGETIDGIPLPADAKSLRLVLRILDEENKLMGLNVDSDQRTASRRRR